MWTIDFITEEDFRNHVKETLLKYLEALRPFDLKRFNKNIIDPVKLLFDRTVEQTSWQDIIQNEIFRQRDKTNTNYIGYFHQYLFKYIKDCTVPTAGWDVIYEPENGYITPDGERVSRIYVELKNKHNTMNSSSTADTYHEMENQILEDDDCVCFVVQVIAKQSQNIKWTPKIDNRRKSHKRMRLVSIDQFLAIVTGEDDAFYQICKALPPVLTSVFEELDSAVQPDDTVYDELIDLSNNCNEEDGIDLSDGLYQLAFPTYLGFEKNKEK